MPRTPTDMDYADVTGASALKPANPAPTAKPVPGVTRTGNSFSQTDSGPSQATRMREGVIGGNSIPISPGSMAARLRGDDTTVAGARLRGDIPVAETPPARIVRTGNSFTSAEANPIAGALDRFRGSQAAATMSGNLDAVRGALPADSPAYMAPSTSAPVATGQTPASAPAANPPTSAPRANPLTSARADRELALDTDAPGIVDKPARAPGDMLRGAAPAGQVDAYGNSTALTQMFKGQLEQGQKETAEAQAAHDAKFAGAPSYAQQQQADADRFTRFVNESDTARLAHDLGTGGGNARSNAGKIAALNTMQQRDAAARNDATARAGQESIAATARGQQAVLSKGQQLQHNAALAQIMGSPLAQQGQLLDNAIKSGTLNQAQALQTLQAQLLEAGKAGDTNKQAQLAILMRQLAGKDAQEGKLISVGGGQEIDSATGQLRALPSSAVYAVPGQAPQILSGTKPTGPSQADLEHTAKLHNMTVEQVLARLQGAK